MRRTASIGWLWAAGAVALAGCGGPPGVGGDPFVMVLGVAQDAGYPQAACHGDCCRRAREDPAASRSAASIAIVDPGRGERWLVDLTPDFPRQLLRLDAEASVPGGHGITGVLLTHAHVGHYAGLIHLGREVMGTWEVPVWAMPRMRAFLAGNAPWEQLVRLHQVVLRSLADGNRVELNDRVAVTPITVPHRDEYSETVAFRIEGPRHTVLYLPDIDGWDRWDRQIEDLLADVDAAWLDGTFYDTGELPDRDPAQVPHPTIRATMDRLAALPEPQRRKIRFLHLNHTNPALDPDSPQAESIRREGFGLAEEGERFGL